MGMINLIDSRLNNLNKNHSYIEEYFSNNLKNKEEKIEKQQNYENYENSDKIENFENSQKINKEKKENFHTNFDKEFYKNMYKDAKIEGYVNEVPERDFQSWEIEKKSQQVCQEDHEHQKDGSSTKCSYGVTNYADPCDLSPIDLKIFMLNYPSNMTLQDYINWLYCFKNKEDELPYNHLKNLKKLQMGKELIEEHGVLPPPSYYYPALNSKDYFDRLYNNENEIIVAPSLNSTTNVMMPFNYDEYSEFSQNFDVKGSTGELRNDDIGLKKNIHKLHDFVAPKDLNRSEIDDQYNSFRWKKVEN